MPRQWADTLITECEQFPKGKHDDLVDSCAQAVRFLRDTGLLTRAPERLAELDESMRRISRNPPPLYCG